MAGKNDPSIYDDRSNIGSSDELDEYGVWVKSEPQDLSSSMPEMEELPDIDDSFADDLDLPDFSDMGDIGEPAGLPEVEFEEIPENSDLPEGSDPVPIDKDGFTEVPMNDFLEAPEGESIDFGNLDSLESPEPQAPASDSGNKGSDLSTQLLMKIADELSSIRTELSTLKGELAMVRGDSAKTETAEAHANAGGFFDEEDDEKIALTGDELDNILNTANFTEEAGSDASEGASEDFGSINLDEGSLDLSGDLGESLSENPDIIGESSDLGIGGGEELSFDEGIDELDGASKIQDSAASPLEDMSTEPISDDFEIALDLNQDGLPDFGESSDTSSIEDTSIEDTAIESSLGDGLDEFREGVAPMTKITEDTSYLDEDPLASAADSSVDDSSFASIDDSSVDNISIDMDMEEHTPETAKTDSDDFTFETEDTMEIPVTEDPLLDDSLQISSEAAGSEEAFPEIENSDETSLPSDFVVEGDGVVPESESLDMSDIPDMPDMPDMPDISGTEDFNLPASENLSAPAVSDDFGASAGAEDTGDGIPNSLKQELKTVLSYMDQLLESLPEDKIEEFAKSEYFDTYKKLFEELGLV